MKRLLGSLLLLFSLSAPATQVIKETVKTISSPNGAYEFVFYQKQLTPHTRQMYYTLTYEGKDVIHESELGVLIENQLFESALGIPNDESKIWGEGLVLTAETRETVDTLWKPVYGERSLIKDQYNQLTLAFEKGDTGGGISDGYDKRRKYFMNLIIRAYDEGIAFRYHFPEATNGLFLHILGEQTQFALPQGTNAWYERWAQGPYELLPLSNWKDESERPLTLQLPNGLTTVLAEAAMIDYARMKFHLNEQKPNTLQASLYSSIDIITPYSTPWRVVMVANQPGELIANNDIFLNLNAPCRIADTSWITPGKVMRSNLKQAEVMETIDFAANMGLQYVHMDAGWYGPEMKMSSDATSVSPDRDLDMPALCAYAESKGIGLWVYVNQRALVQQLDELLPLYREWGLKGIKFGFVQIGNQHWSTWLHDAIRKCAEHEMMVDIHDEYRPTGFSRTYPNLMTQEGIRGNEEMPDATHNVILPFTRFLCGAADYTLCYYSGRKKTTYAHQLAMAAVYYSPIQFMFWYDTPKQYQGEPELEFWKNIPTVWEDTRVLSGAIGQHIAMARRSGNEWFVGIMTNNDPRKLTLSADFLEPGRKYEVRLYEDDDKAKTRTRVRITTKRAKTGDTFTFTLKASGGAAMHFIPLN
ncbi:glycoside hydrolase family 97 protein [Bacteroides sp. 51]|uniref:glycoside hydrolase family 97 protein n=1 Tax=Bacteroides sp. 51 TaxID=2302938 RepID=UPI0013D46F37|nr:glycoside hydrolase family 97 protein [Bacteroides sp. 51]NDV83659.1 alpha-glucosidase [Bacteroides sp. 51]